MKYRDNEVVKWRLSVDIVDYTEYSIGLCEGIKCGVCVYAGIGWQCKLDGIFYSTPYLRNGKIPETFKRYDKVES